MTPFDDTFFSLLLRLAGIGLGATALMDVWLLLLKRRGVPTLNFALLGRWVGHMRTGRFAHTAIAQATPVRGELALGWAAHYATGLALATALVAVAGTGWPQAPTLLPALGLGVASVVLPLFVMQPALGAGVASSRTSAPLKNCIKSLANHTVFGLGLYIAAQAISTVAQA